MKHSTSLTRTVLGWPIVIQVHPMGDDIQILIYGGTHPHIGAVSMAWFEQEELKINTLTYASHREDIITSGFASAFAKCFHVTVSVSCGIHYEYLATDDIQLIMNEVGEMLQFFVGQNAGELQKL